MTKEERTLLIMLSKDMRRLWDRNPTLFGVDQFFRLHRDRKRAYDHFIEEVENGKEHEADREDS